MKTLTITLLLITSTAFAAGTLEKDSSNSATIQGFAPNGLLSQILTVNSTTVDLSSNLYWSLYAPTACKFRLMPTSAKGAYPQLTVPATERTGFVVNRKSQFINFSGCTLAELQLQ